MLYKTILLFVVFLCSVTFLCAQTYTFTTAGASGRFGPSQIQLNAVYATSNLNGLVTTTSGIQNFTVPATGVYKITSKGAKGGDGQSGIGGPGAVMTGDFYLTGGQVLKICVGQMGLAGHQGGGGGGSFVTDMSNNPLIIAGGGGGAHNSNTATFSITNMSGSSGTSGMNGVNENFSVTAGFGGTAGNGGLTSSVTADGSAGGGLLTNGEDGNPSMGGLAFVNGATGGAGATTTTGIGGDGGFGGGGGADWTDWTGSGGGGGYSGGGGGVHFGLGGGGGSFNSGSNQLNSTGTNSTSGSVVFTKIAGVTILQTASVSCYGQLTAAITGSAFGGLGPYTYTWLPTNTHAYNETGIGAGTYTCIVQDANGMIFTNSFVVSQPAQLVATITQTNISCFGEIDGKIKVTPSGGTLPYSYSWLPSHPGTSTLSGLSAGNYTNTLTDANGCSVTSTVSITEPPVFTISAIASVSSVCAGQTAVLSGSNGLTYTWSHGVNNSTAFIPAATAIYTLTGTNASGCIATATTEISVIPVPTLSIAGSNSLCAGSSISFTASGANAYAWNASATGSVFTDSPVSSIVYTLTGISNGCGSSITQSVTVFTNSVGAHASSTSVCTGHSITLYGSGASGYTWSGGVNNNVAFVPGSSTVYTLTGANPCFTPTQTIAITVHTLPSITAQASQSVVCLNNTTTLYGAGGISYTWSGGVSDNVPFSPSSTTVYTVTGMDANGCQNTAVQAVHVNSLPVVTASASSSAFCFGDATILNGMGAVSYVWSDNIQNNTSFTPTASHTYTVTGTDANGCENSATQSILVNPLPVIQASASSSVVCSGNPATLSGAGADTYTWTGGHMNGISFIPVITDTYSVSGTNTLTGCTSTNAAYQTIVVNPLPLVSSSVSNSVICDTDPVTLKGSNADVYTWTGGVTDGVPFSPSVSSVYTVTGTNTLTGCMNTATQSIIVNALPALTISVSGSVVCSGHSVILQATGADIYTWSGGVTNNMPFYPTSGNTYSVTGTHTLTGCSNTLSQVILVNLLPVITVSTSSAAVCVGNTVALSAQGANTYTWSGNVLNGIPFSPATTATYSVTGTNTLSGCTNSTVQQVIVYPLPQLMVTQPATLICTGESIDLTVNGAQAYMWSTNEITSSIRVSPVTITHYSVTGIDGNMCLNSATVIINVSECLGITSQMKQATGVTVFPNPNNGEFYISTDKEMTFSIVNSLGQVVRTIFVDGRSEYFVSDLPNGIYFLVGRRPGELIRTKVVVEE